MRHGKKINHLGRTAPHRKAMLSNMATSLIQNKRIVTTLAKAKALRKYVEPIITKSKNDTTHSRRMVFRYLQDKESVNVLFHEVSEKVGDREGGYTRIFKTGNRLGDNASMCVIELVDYNETLLKESKPKKSRTRRGRRSKGGAQESGAVATAVAAETVAAKVTETEVDETADSEEVTDEANTVEAAADQDQESADVIAETAEEVAEEQQVEDAAEAEEAAEDTAEETEAAEDTAEETEATEDTAEETEATEDTAEEAEEATKESADDQTDEEE
jgi:large subunit ribosomal protein L17